MGTLWSELGPLADRATAGPRVYVDANVPAGVVAYMRAALGWDVLFVIEQPDLRRARDDEHFRLARRLRRTLVTLDRDYLDDKQFPPHQSAGVLVITGADARVLEALLGRLHQELFRATTSPLPLEGRKLLAQSDWSP